MKLLNRSFALLLALVLLLSCGETVFAFSGFEKESYVDDAVNADIVPENTKDAYVSSVPEDIENAGGPTVGYNSIDFKSSNTYQYADDEIVRAIVLLEGTPEIEVGEPGSTKAGNQRVKLVNQHNTVFREMKDIDYELIYEYTQLLNGFSCDVAYGDLDFIAAIDGVRSVHIANEYEAPVAQTLPATRQSNINGEVGNDLMYQSQWNGRGTVIAVLDTGLNVSHEAFQYYEGMVDEVVTPTTIASADLPRQGRYISPKIPFAYDYAQKDTDVTDHSGHGTHVAGSAVGLAGRFEGDEFVPTFVGAAPCAQLLFMKIFPDTAGNAYTDVYYRAMEDAYALGADVINLSIGTPCGFTTDYYLRTEIFDDVFQDLSDAGVIVSISAGNASSMVAHATNYYRYSKSIGPEYTDYGTIGSPAAYNGAISVASKNNSQSAIRNNEELPVTNDSAASGFITTTRGGEMSDSSNWGTTPMLTLDPTITAIGGSVYSATRSGTNTYGLMSGTSMAAPNMTGIFASLLSAIYEQHPNMEKTKAAELAKDLLYSGAILLLDDEDRHYSPRKAGVGLGSAWNAIQLYHKAAYITNPIQELGDDPQKSGVYTMSLELKNESGQNLVYTDFEAYVLFDKLTDRGDGILRNAMCAEYAYVQDDATTDAYGRGANVTYQVNGKEVSRIDLAAGKSVTVEVTISLTQAQKSYFDQNYPNGSFVEGYIVFNEVQNGEKRTASHATFLAYYGDWAHAPVLEAADFRDVIQTEIYLNNTIADSASGESYADKGVTWQKSRKINYYTHPNMAFLTDSFKSKIYAYAGGGMLGHGETFYPEHISFTTEASDSDRKLGRVLYMEPYLLRNVTKIGVYITDKNTGALYYTKSSLYQRKSTFDSSSNTWKPTCYFSWDGKDRSGEYVPSGTVATVVFYATLPYKSSEQEPIWTFDVTVDYVAPTLNYQYNENTGILTVTGTDEHYLQALYLEDSTGEIIDAEVYSSNEKGKSFTTTFDIAAMKRTGKYTKVNICALDYATNITVEEFPIPGASVANVRFLCPEGASASSVITTCGTTLTLPQAMGNPIFGSRNYKFLGWVTAPVLDTVSRPTYYPAGHSITVRNDQVYYALYSYSPNLMITYYTTVPESNSVESGVGPLKTLYQVFHPDGLGSGVYALTARSRNGTFYTLHNHTGQSSVAVLASPESYAFAPQTVSVKQIFIFNVSYADGEMTIKTPYGRYLYGYFDAAGTARLELSETACTWIPTFQPDGGFTLKTKDGCYLSLRDDLSGRGENGNPLFIVSDRPTTGSTSFYLFRDIYTDPNCTHSFTTKETEPTCEEEGYTTYTCTKCYYSYRDDYLQSFGHNMVTAKALAPTCTKDGRTEYEYCTNCGLIEVAPIVIPATGHNYSVTIVSPGCEAEGYTIYICSKCKHSYKNNYTAATGHQYGSAITTAPTCDRAGVRTFTCYKCNKKHTEEIPATGHSYQSVVTPPTCTDAGYTTHTCTICGYRYTDSTLAPLGHRYTSKTSPPTCTDAGYTIHTCTVCGYSYTDSSVPATEHCYTEEITPPTCTDAGYTTYTCSACGHSYTDSTVAATGHRYTSEVTKPATCDKNGIRTYTCSECNHSYARAILSTGHNYTKELTPPTCTKAGYTINTCSKCGDRFTSDPIAALGHQAVIDEAIAATCTTSGLTEGSHCSACKEILEAQESIAPLGHRKTYMDCGGRHEVSCERCDYRLTEAHSFVDGACICGAPEAAPSTQVNIKIGHSLALDSDLGVKYRVKYSDIKAAVPNYVTEGAYLVIEKDVYPAGGKKTVETYTLAADLASDPSRILFDLKGIQAAEMGSELRAVLHIFDGDGKEYVSAVDVYSIQTYAEQYLETYDYEMQPKFFTMLIDLLNYGAAAQVNFDRRTNELVNAGFEAYQQYATKELAAELTDVKETIPNDRNLTAVTKMGFSVNMADRIEINAKMTLASSYTMEDISKVVVLNEAGEVVETITEFKLLTEDNNRVQVTFSGVKAVNLRDMFYFVAYVGDEVASDNIGYSVEAFARSNMATGSANSIHLIRCCMYYGDSAYGYFTKGN